MTQTSKTESMTISLLKHLNGNTLGTTTTLVDHWLMCEVLLAVDQNRLLMAPHGRLRRLLHHGRGHQLQQGLEQ